MLTPYLPFPLTSGGQIRSYNLLKNLSKKHDITLIALIKHEDEKKYIQDLEKYCKKIIVAKRPEKPWTLTNIVKTGFGKYPFLVVRNYSEEAREAVISELKHNSYDLIHAETFYVMPHIPKTDTPILLVEQTIEYEVYQHFVETIKIPPLRFLLSIDVRKIKEWETYFWKQATRVIAMSQPDREVMQKKVTQIDVSIVPNGVDTSFFDFKEKKLTFAPKILFVGNFKWLQNREAATILVHKIWPIISKKLPQSKLWIVGKYPTTEILSLADERVKISENVEDIREAYENSHLLLAPIYGPGGTRYKILEAMACGLPVITTPHGIDGLGVIDGNEALIRKDVKDLAAATIKVLTSQVLFKQLASKANTFVRTKYNWQSIAGMLDRIYESVAHEKTN